MSVPAQFSPDLIERFIKLFSFERDTIIDIFNGVGNTGIAAIKNNRNYIGIDLSKDYIEITRKRLSEISCNLFNFKGV